MKCHWILLVFFVAIAPSIGGEPLLEHTDVYTSGEDGYDFYRIPAIETAPDGTLLAFAEARKFGGSDPGFGKQDIDLVLKRSRDRGKTWSEMKLVEDPGERWSAANPATVVDRQTGRVWVVYVRSKPGRSSWTARPGTDDMQTLTRWSGDNGATWSSPIDLTAVARDMQNSQWRCSIPGPGGAIQTHSGRLLVPLSTQPGNTPNSLSAVLAIYSDDHGQTWHRSEFVPGERRGNENQLVELADGGVLMDVRQKEGPRRWMTISHDSGQTWSEPCPGVAVTPCACAIERFTLTSAGDDRNRIIWTGPKGPGRKGLVVRVSYDEGTTFPVGRVLSQEPAAYSDLAMLKDETAGCLWERGGYRFITFTRFNRAFLEPDGPPAKK